MNSVINFLKPAKYGKACWKLGSCEKCEKFFRNACNKCEKTFCNWQHMKRHTNSKHGMKIVICNHNFIFRQEQFILPISSFLPPPQMCPGTDGTPGYALGHLFSPVCKMKYAHCFSRPLKTFLPKHYVAGDHVHRTVLHHSLLGLILCPIKGRCNQLSFLNNFDIFSDN